MSLSESTFGIRLAYFDKSGNAHIMPVSLQNIPKLTMDVNADIKLSLKLDVEFYGKFNYAYDRIALFMIFDGTEYNAGKYVIVSATNNGNGKYSLICFDLCQLLKRTKLEHRKYFAAGTPYSQVISTFIEESGITNYNVIESNMMLPYDREDWEPGTNYLNIVNELLDEIAYRRVYMDMDGVVRCEPQKNTDFENVTKTYYNNDITNILLPDSTIDIDEFDHPNVFYYSCENPNNSEPMYVNLTNASPDDQFSVINSPRNPIFKSINNVANIDVLETMATIDMEYSRISHNIVEFDTALALHNPNEILSITKNEFDGIVRETNFTMPLKAGSVMHHVGEQAIIRWQY